MTNKDPPKIPKRTSSEVTELLLRVLQFEHKYPQVKPSSILSFVKWDLSSYIKAKTTRGLKSPIYEGEQITLGSLLLDYLIYSPKHKFDQLVKDLEILYDLKRYPEP